MKRNQSRKKQNVKKLSPLDLIILSLSKMSQEEFGSHIQKKPFY